MTPIRSAPALSYEQVVAAWSAHLRDGGTTEWSAFRDAVPDQDVVHIEAPRPLPDATHLELVRRVNLASGGVAHPALADRILSTGSPGRGLIDVPLPWPEAPRRFGSPAIEPGRLPDEELVRLAVGVLAHLLPGVPPTAAPLPGPPPLRWPWPWRRRFRLHGSPGTAAGVRALLLAAGHVETDWRPTHIVLARPVEVMMAEHWADQARAGGILKWSTLWRRAVAAGSLPDPIDVVGIADRLGGRRGETVHVVVAQDAHGAAALAAGVLRTQVGTLPTSGDPAQTDLLRRLNRLSALTAGPGHGREVARTMSHRMAGVMRQTPVPDDAPAPVTPAAALPWARQEAAATAETLRRAGYAVHGDPDALAPTGHRQPGTIDRARTLEVAVMACLRSWQLQEGRT